MTGPAASCKAKQVDFGLLPPHVESPLTTADMVDAINFCLPHTQGYADEGSSSSNGLAGCSWRVDPAEDAGGRDSVAGLTVLDLEVGIREIALSAAATDIRLSTTQASVSSDGGVGSKNPPSASVHHML